LGTKIQLILFPFSNNRRNDQQPQQQQPPKGGGVVELARGSGFTPFHMLDQYMMAVFQRFNLKTKVRTWCIICCNVRTTMTREDGTEEEASKKVYQLQYQVSLGFGKGRLGEIAKRIRKFVFSTYFT
jgi:hypothetical protein